MVYGEAKFDLWDQINISCCMWFLAKKGGYYVGLKYSRCENNARIFMLNILDGHLSMRLTLSYPSNKSSYFSWITLYVVHGISKFSLLGFYCIPCISTYLGDDAMIVHQHLTCVSKFWVLRFSGLTGIVRYDRTHSGIFTLYWWQIWGLIFAIFQFRHFSILRLHP